MNNTTNIENDILINKWFEYIQDKTYAPLQNINKILNFIYSADLYDSEFEEIASDLKNSIESLLKYSDDNKEKLLKHIKNDEEFLEFIKNSNNTTFFISINKYSEGFISIEQDSKNIYRSSFGFELPFDIAENIAHALSYAGKVELEDENYMITIYKNGKIIDEYKGEE